MISYSNVKIYERILRKASCKEIRRTGSHLPEPVKIGLKLDLGSNRVKGQLYFSNFIESKKGIISKARGKIFDAFWGSRYLFILSKHLLILALLMLQSF